KVPEVKRNKKQIIELFISRINGKAPLVYPSCSPITPAVTHVEDGTSEPEIKWIKYFSELQQKKKQLQIDIEWEEFLSRFDYSIVVYNK
ncbi:18172_t:CDS:1, partial [Racocetra fulgida]